MSKTIYSVLIIIAVFISSCDQPLKPKVDNEVKFDLQVDFGDLKRITSKAPINLSWSEITLDNFKEIKIKRFNVYRDINSYPVDSTENDWKTIATIASEFTTSWVDTVTDDAKFIYKVIFYDQDGNYRETESTITLPLTTRINFPSDINSLHKGTASYIIDDGDSIYISAGIHQVQAFSFHNKSILVKGKDGADKTVLKWIPRYTSSGKALDDSSFIFINNGLLEDVTIQSGRAEYGGGIRAVGNARVRNCILRECSASTQSGFKRGFGYSIYLSDNALIENCIFRNDSTWYTNNVDADYGVWIDNNGMNVQIRNCVFFNNYLRSETPSALVENSIFLGSQNYPYSPYPSVEAGQRLTVNYCYAGPNWKLIDETNLTGELKLEYFPDDLHLLIQSSDASIPLDFHPSQGSVCIDAGNPDILFIDKDGTRNDLGAYGGPYGGW